MALFPTTYSTLSSPALAKELTEKYGLADARCQFLVRGVADTYRVDTHRARFILRVYRSSHRKLEQIEAEVKLLLALKQSDVSAAYPIEDKTGQFIQQLDAAEGIRHAVLFTYAPGDVVAILNPGQLRLLGQQMANFHNVSTTLDLGTSRWKFDVNTTLVNPLRMTETAFAEDPEGYVMLKEKSEQVRRQLGRFNTSTFSSGYCHFDFLSKNFHFEGDHRLTFFDFDFFGYGWTINDVMTFWVQLCLDVHFGRMKQFDADRAYEIFVAAYRDHRAINDEELAAIPYLSLGFWLFYLGFYTTHDQFYPLLTNPHLKARTTMIRQLMNRYVG